jgi:Flp pilus assembly protein TadD
MTNSCYDTAWVPSLYTEALAALPLAEDGTYLQEGKALLQSYQTLQGTEQADAALVQDWCRRLLHDLQEQKEWKRALALLQTARELRPNDAGLRDQEISIWNILAKEYMQGKQWEFAALIYEQALDRFPQEALFVNNLKYCRQKRDQAQSTFQ